MATTPTPQDLITATHWISIAQVVATAFVGVIAGFITWKMQSKQIDIANGLREIARAQHETAATKLRLELFEKRFEAYTNVVKAMQEVFDFGLEQSDLTMFDVDFIMNNAIAPMRYLFDDSIYNLLKENIYSIVADYLITNEHTKNHGVLDPEYIKLQNENTTKRVELHNLMRELGNKIVPYLRIV